MRIPERALQNSCYFHPLMADQKNEKINQLHRLVPEGLVVDTAWLEKHGYRRQWREKYVAQGWLEGVVRGVYQRPTGNVDQAIAWQRVIISLQRLLDKSVHVGGRSALELRGLTHYLRFSGEPEIHLYAYGSLPGWVERIPTDAQFVEHKAEKLFDADAPGRTRLAWDTGDGSSMCLRQSEHFANFSTCSRPGKRSIRRTSSWSRFAR